MVIVLRYRLIACVSHYYQQRDPPIPASSQCISHYFQHATATINGIPVPSSAPKTSIHDMLRIVVLIAFQLFSLAVSATDTPGGIHLRAMNNPDPFPFPAHLLARRSCSSAGCSTGYSCCPNFPSLCCPTGSLCYNDGSGCSALCGPSDTQCP